MRRYKFVPFFLSIIMLVVSIMAVGKSEIQTKPVNSATIDEVSEDLKGIWVSYITLDMQNSGKTKEDFKNKFENIINTTKENIKSTDVNKICGECKAKYQQM